MTNSSQEIEEMPSKKPLAWETDIAIKFFGELCSKGHLDYDEAISSVYWDDEAEKTLKDLIETTRKESYDKGFADAFKELINYIARDKKDLLSGEVNDFGKGLLGGLEQVEALMINILKQKILSQ